MRGWMLEHDSGRYMRRLVATAPAAMADPALRTRLLGTRDPATLTALLTSAPAADVAALLPRALGLVPEAVRAALQDRGAEIAPHLTRVQLAALLAAPDRDLRSLALRLAHHTGHAPAPRR